MGEVVFVGTSDAFGAGGRRQSAILVRAEAGSVLLDCGMTTNTGLEALSIPRDELDAILVSHYHGDHFGGIPPLLLSCLYADRRRRPLVIAGPTGIERRVRELARHLGFSLEGRDWTFPIEFVELATDRGQRAGPAAVRAFETFHQPEVAPHGLVLDVGGRRIAFSGDTGWFDGLPGQVAGADLFVCECTLLEAEFEYHLSLEELVERKGHFDVNRLVVTHLGPEMAARRGACELETADDGLVIPL
jgi:ribonuclease BN (tRNA processing enzyme)